MNPANPINQRESTMEQAKQTETRLRFRINMLLAERDMTIKQLYDKVRQMGCDVSSSHFYRQMKPYYSPMRMDLLTYVVRALNAKPSELFDLVEVEVGDGFSGPARVLDAGESPKRIDEKSESDKAKKARATAKQKRNLALLGTKIAVFPNGPSKPA